MSTSDDLRCPFCGEDDMDAIGLKLHLMKWCEEFDKVDVSNVRSLYGLHRQFGDEAT